MALEAAALGVAEWSMTRPARPTPPTMIETRLIPPPPPVAPPPPPKMLEPPKPPPPRPAPHIVAHRSAPAAPEAKIARKVPTKDQKTVALADVPATNVTSDVPNSPGPAFEPKAEAPPPPAMPVARPRPPPPISRPPEVVDHPTPALSAELRAQDFQGQALLLFVVDDAGHARPHLLQSTGNAQIDALALEAARHWTFKPALDKGKPVGAQLQVEMQISVE